MVQVQQKNLFLAHYRILESDIDLMSRYIEFSDDNMSTYSIQLVHFLLAVGSEVDVLLKELCSFLDSTSKSKNIQNYKTIVCLKEPEIINKGVLCRKYGLDFIPWQKWEGDTHPNWWASYNAVKHERNVSFKEANLGSALNAIAGLYILNVYYNHEVRQSETNFPLDMHNTIHDLDTELNLFIVDDPFFYIKD